MNEPARYIIAGLGNPGRIHAGNRHNVGFMVVDRLAEQHGLKFDRMMHMGMVALGEIAGHKVALVKPQTFMNLSGECVGPLMRFYKSTPHHVMAIYDDLDLALGQLRMRPKGSAGGHNGMKSLIVHLGTTDFPRLRVGIGRPPGRQSTRSYVLEDFLPNEWPTLREAIERAAHGVVTWLSEGLEIAMSRVNASPDSATEHN
ncbi:MAG: aminoacyl-tRNA hydrolase [Thermoflexales bacterium]